MVIFPDGDMFVAQALEVDIAAQGRSTDEACRRFRLAVNAEQVEAFEAVRDPLIAEPLVVDGKLAPRDVDELQGLRGPGVERSGAG